ncbi:MAG: sensor histidine kinase, partial [Pyrinomonadaceae bacterium]
PLRRWLDRRFHDLFVREAAIYRDVVARIGAHAGRYQQLPELLGFLEERIAAGLGLRRVRLLTRGRSPAGSDNEGGGDFQINNDGLKGEGGAETEGLGGEPAEWVARVLEQARAQEESGPLEGVELLRARGFEIVYALVAREGREVGLMAVDADADALTYDVRAVLEILAGQVAIAIEDCRLVEENVSLERRLAQGERLAALGQMAATVAHEVKNPLSAIKSIAQVMREDERLSGEYARDLDLIVGETDRLNRSVTQMLSFARHPPHAAAPQRADEVVRAVVELFRLEAGNRGVVVEYSAGGSDGDGGGAEGVILDGARAAVVRDALSNLLLNALQATPTGGRVSVEARVAAGDYLIAVTDGGRGVAPEMRARIWEPFFTTKQRGTGLGLAIVRKRMEEVGGAATLAESSERGSRFELRLPPARLHEVGGAGQSNGSR